MKNVIKSLMMTMAFVPVLAVGVVMSLPPSTAMAGQPRGADADAANEANCSETNINVSSGAACAKTADQDSSLSDVIVTITNVLLFIIGAVAVIMIILGGIRYTISNGDSSQITSAKNTILYGVIGLIVALLAYAIVNFVITAFTNPPAGGGGGNNAAQ